LSKRSESQLLFLDSRTNNENNVTKNNVEEVKSEDAANGNGSAAVNARVCSGTLNEFTNRVKKQMIFVVA
jgi:hypothetical protein